MSEKVCYIHLENGMMVTSKRDADKPPKDVVAICPKDESGKWVTKMEVLDVVDGIATINLEKLAAYQQAKADKLAAEAQANAQKAAAIAQLKQTGSDDVKQLMQILGL